MFYCTFCPSFASLSQRCSRLPLLSPPVSSRGFQENTNSPVKAHVRPKERTLTGNCLIFFLFFSLNLIRSSSPVRSLLNNLPLFFQSSVQDWGEEVEEGAIYNVTLKRVQIQQAANKGARWLGVSWHLEFLHKIPKSGMSSSVDWVYLVYKCHFKGPVCMKACWKKQTIFMFMFVVFPLPQNTKQIHTLGYCRYVTAQYGHLHVKMIDF